MSRVADRPPDLRRCVLFVAGADVDAQARALASRPDVLVQDLEDLTPDSLKDVARARTSTLCAQARQRNIMFAARINSLMTTGIADLAAVMPALTQLIFLPKVVDA